MCIWSVLRGYSQGPKGDQCNAWMPTTLSRESCQAFIIIQLSEAQLQGYLSCIAFLAWCLYRPWNQRLDIHICYDLNMKHLHKFKNWLLSPQSSQKWLVFFCFLLCVLYCMYCIEMSNINVCHSLITLHIYIEIDSFTGPEAYCFL